MSSDTTSHLEHQLSATKNKRVPTSTSFYDTANAMRLFGGSSQGAAIGGPAHRDSQHLNQIGSQLSLFNGIVPKTGNMSIPGDLEKLVVSIADQ